MRRQEPHCNNSFDPMTFSSLPILITPSVECVKPSVKRVVRLVHISPSYKIKGNVRCGIIGSKNPDFLHHVISTSRHRKSAIFQSATSVHTYSRERLSRITILTSMESKSTHHHHYVIEYRANYWHNKADQASNTVVLVLMEVLELSVVVWVTECRVWYKN